MQRSATNGEKRTLTAPEPDEPKVPEYKFRYNWANIIFMAYCHMLGAYGLYLAIFHAKWQTLIWTVFLSQLTTLGVTAGVHRLWSHRAYKAKYPLQIFLAIIYTMGHQQSIFKWVRDHRVHHKYSDTHGDPHNIGRGFFFSHMGWVLCNRHPELIAKGKTVDFSDIHANPVVSFQHQHYYKIMPFVAVLLPTAVPIYYWSETWLNSFMVATMLRYCFTLNATFSVNSVAHRFGYKPYDTDIWPGENLGVTLATMGEGWHNYHHAFPWDYRTAELGSFNMNFTTIFIDWMAAIGQAYDLKTTSKDMIVKRKQRTGELKGEFARKREEEEQEEVVRDLF